VRLRRVIWAANLILLGVLGYWAADLFWSPAGPATPGAPSAHYGEMRRGAAGARRPAPDPGDKPFSGENLFGPAADAAAAKPATPKDAAAVPAEKAKLALRLLGTVAGDPAISRAVIEDARTRLQDIFKVGDYVQGARLESIAEQHVVLLIGDRRETLNIEMLPSEPAAPGETAKAPAAPPTPVGQEASGKPVTVLSDSKFEVDKQSFMARVGGMEAILKATKLTPHVVDGKTVGIQVSGLENVSMAKYVGLENGDVIQVVNGQGLDSLQKLFQVFRKARTQPDLNIRLLRGEETKELSFSIK
jgi:general secretion pathway protein C